MIPLLETFKALIRERCGLTFDGVGEEPLVLALERRLAATGLEAGGYLTRLGHDESEFAELVSLLTINETYFFREPEHISLFTQTLLPRLLAQRGGTPVRVLSAGCSTGEEPYSLAMALLETHGEAARHLVSITGADIDRVALARAREGRYGTFSFRTLEAHRRARFFSPEGRIAPEVAAMVHFTTLNLLAPPEPEETEGYDIIFCRNVFIYFETPTRRTILTYLRQRLRTPGFLLVGLSETLANDLGVLPLVQEDGLFYFEMRSPVPATASTPLASPPRMPAPALPSPLLARSAPSFFPPAPKTPLEPGRPSLAPPLPSSPRDPVREARRLIQDKNPAQARAVLAPALRVAPEGDTSLRLLDAFALLHLRETDAAERAAARVLESNPWSIEASLILGFAARARGNTPDAVRWFKQAVYARHNCWVAQYYLGEAHRAAGADELARRAYRLALVHLDAHPDPDGGLGLPLGLPVREVRFLCERHAALAEKR
ncbi:CheR family methyltransferase [Pararhodospirillum photometricum]|uniref:Methylase of chemotaxis methyl-accepting protein n=1 Tax=Pararhodospirillum photometricum DSM 122 TaxID=1150469 RepID=H6SRT1_PARPM|nr:protein-glutamate O-methyltransferase CheR [Pararhodospirillum photometricum]CCG07610.1 Methylase of chemotaxis methyl-accepting protein [Pararhodospirillum photometricum DSM 122]